MAEPNSAARGREFTSTCPVPGEWIDAFASSCLFAMPVPAVVWALDVNHRPKRQEVLAMLLVDLVNVDVEAPLRESSYAANTGVAVGVARDAAITGADVVLFVETERPATDLFVEKTAGWKCPLSHDY